jgi:hypothetical protein
MFMILALGAAPGAGLYATAREALALDCGTFLRGILYSNPERVALDGGPDGAYSPVNKAWDATGRGAWYIEEQRTGFDAVAAGLAWDRPDLVERGRKILDWGFAHQDADGGFSCPDAFHSASFFVEAAAHAALLLQAEGGAQDKAWVERITPALRRAARWMADPAHEKPGLAHDAPYAHRCFLDACALGESGVLAGDPMLVRRSWAYVQDGLARQRPDGVDPEKGGADTSYQAVGLLYAVDYALLVATPSQRRAFYPLMQRGLGWLEGRLGPDGRVDETGNTRSGPGGEYGRNHTPKKMSYGSAIRASEGWAQLSGETRWHTLALRLAQGMKASRHR